MVLEKISAKQKEKIYSEKTNKIFSLLKAPYVEDLDVVENCLCDYFENIFHNPQFSAWTKPRHRRKELIYLIISYWQQLNNDENKRWEKIEKFLCKDHYIATTYVTMVMKNSWNNYEEFLKINPSTRRIWHYWWSVHLATQKKASHKLPEYLHNFMVANALKNDRFSNYYLQGLKNNN
jgi:hypothetical protein